jgi:hypothetical protein
LNFIERSFMLFNDFYASWLFIAFSVLGLGGVDD